MRHYGSGITYDHLHSRTVADTGRHDVLCRLWHVARSERRLLPLVWRQELSIGCAPARVATPTAFRTAPGLSTPSTLRTTPDGSLRHVRSFADERALNLCFGGGVRLLAGGNCLWNNCASSDSCFGRSGRRYGSRRHHYLGSGRRPNGNFLHLLHHCVLAHLLLWRHASTSRAELWGHAVDLRERRLAQLIRFRITD